MGLLDRWKDLSPKRKTALRFLARPARSVPDFQPRFSWGAVYEEREEC